MLMNVERRRAPLLIMPCTDFITLPTAVPRLASERRFHTAAHPENFYDHGEQRVCCGEEFRARCFSVHQVEY